MERNFAVPSDLSREELARKLTAILRVVHRESVDGNKDGAYGPFRKDRNSDLHWQLDSSNDWFLHFDEELQGSAMLRCRDYPRLEGEIDEVLRQLGVELALEAMSGIRN